jgi:hypothetical protein
MPFPEPRLSFNQQRIVPYLVHLSVRQDRLE